MKEQSSKASTRAGARRDSQHEFLDVITKTLSSSCLISPEIPICISVYDQNSYSGDEYDWPILNLVHNGLA